MPNCLLNVLMEGLLRQPNEVEDFTSKNRVEYEMGTYLLAWNLYDSFSFKYINRDMSKCC